MDDIADEPGELADKRPRLAAWRDRIAGLYRGEADDPVTRVLVAAVSRFALRAEDFVAVVDGMQMDAETVIVAPDLATLDLYCDRVAAAVGRLSVRAFGDASPAADRVAHALGRALQLTNILRDLREDADRGRLYLPHEYLDAAGVPRDPEAALASPRLGEVCARVVTLAREVLRRGQRDDGAVRSAGDEAGTADGRDLRRDPLPPGATGLVAVGAARRAAAVAEAVACGALCLVAILQAPAQRPGCTVYRIPLTGIAPRCSPSYRHCGSPL